MPRTCTICMHSDRSEIDAALVAGEAFRNIAERTGTSATALVRHKGDHIPARLAKAEAAEATQADDLLGQLLALNRETMTILHEARGSGDNELALRAIARAERQVELQAKLLGELREGTTVNVLISPQWHELRAVIVNALVSFPEAKRDVIEALGKLHVSA